MFRTTGKHFLNTEYCILNMCHRDLEKSRTFINLNHLMQWYLYLPRVKYPTNIKYINITHFCKNC